MASLRSAEARGWGWTVGPAEAFGAGGGEEGGAFVVCGGACACEVAGVDVGGRGPLGPLGYWRAAEPAAREAFDPEAPIVDVV